MSLKLIVVLFINLFLNTQSTQAAVVNSTNWASLNPVSLFLRLSFTSKAIFVGVSMIAFILYFSKKSVPPSDNSVGSSTDKFNPPLREDSTRDNTPCKFLQEEDKIAKDRTKKIIKLVLNPTPTENIFGKVISFKIQEKILQGKIIRYQHIHPFIQGVSTQRNPPIQTIHYVQCEQEHNLPFNEQVFTLNSWSIVQVT